MPRDPEIAALLVALRMKGETADEIAAAARCCAIAHGSPGIPAGADVLDTSAPAATAAAPSTSAPRPRSVARRRRRAGRQARQPRGFVRSGRRDVLVELGVSFEGDAACARRCLDETGLGFCFAPLFHPALKHVAGPCGSARVSGRCSTVWARSPIPAATGGSTDRCRPAGTVRHDRRRPGPAGTRRLCSSAAGDGLDEVSLRRRRWSAMSRAVR